jgi:xanthine/CO dehydrogenase XdhC/CoxF family maturation factor
LSDLGLVLALWQQATAAGEDYVLASIVRVEGSSYRKPGARMLITQSGRRAGTISGGCLEAEVSRQAWWLTENGPVVKAYSTSFEIDEEDDTSDSFTSIVRPYNLGCGGVVHLLLERRATADAFLQAAHVAFSQRDEFGCATILEGNHMGQRAFAHTHQPEAGQVLASAARAALKEQQTTIQSNLIEQQNCQVWAEYLPPRCGLFIFGAGDDAQPLVAQALTLGWQVIVADGRAHLASRDRFPGADRVLVLDRSDLSSLQLRPNDAAVLMTHSFDQDSRLLAQLLPMPLLYLGVLGPRYRTADLVQHTLERIGGTVVEWMQKVHAPVGLDLGADSPATIALSIVAEIQATLYHQRSQAVTAPATKTARMLNRRVG